MGHDLTVGARRAFLIAVGALSLTVTGCSFLAGEHDATTTFLVSPQANGSYWGWSEITIPQDADSVDGATLQFARLELPEDSKAPDLTFLQNILAEVVVPDQRVSVAKKDQFPPEEVVVPLDLLYEGDLREFFPDGRTIRIEWTGQRNPAVEIPPEGYWVDVRVRIKVE
ncbi:MAG: hypothetical protein IPK82_12450 [Polyangiaceae bacterium]|nr:hypothetical protein [Polyangiaceae bacterium]